jgi:membrane protein DedA with SNARE-associated domain
VFVPANLFACALWSVIIGSLGYVFSSWVTRIISTMDEISGRAPAIIGGVALFMAVVVLGRYAVLKFWRSRETL